MADGFTKEREVNIPQGLQTNFENSIYSLAKFVITLHPVVAEHDAIAKKASVDYKEGIEKIIHSFIESSVNESAKSGAMYIWEFNMRALYTDFKEDDDFKARIDEAFK